MKKIKWDFMTNYYIFVNEKKITSYSIFELNEWTRILCTVDKGWLSKHIAWPVGNPFREKNCRNLTTQNFNACWPPYSLTSRFSSSWSLCTSMLLRKVQARYVYSR